MVQSKYMGVLYFKYDNFLQILEKLEWRVVRFIIVRKFPPPKILCKMMEVLDETYQVYLLNKHPL